MGWSKRRRDEASEKKARSIAYHVWIIVHTVDRGGFVNELQQGAVEYIRHLLAPADQCHLQPSSGVEEGYHMLLDEGQNNMTAGNATHVQSLRTIPSSRSQRGCPGDDVLASDSGRGWAWPELQEAARCAGRRGALVEWRATSSRAVRACSIVRAARAVRAAARYGAWWGEGGLAGERGGVASGGGWRTRPGAGDGPWRALAGGGGGDIEREGPGCDG